MMVPSKFGVVNVYLQSTALSKGCSLPMKKYSNLFSNLSFLIPKDEIRRMKTK